VRAVLAKTTYCTLSAVDCISVLLRKDPRWIGEECIMALRELRFDLRSWFWIGSIWLGLGLFDATQTVVVMQSEGMRHTWATLFGVTVVSWVPWAVATPFVLRLARRFPPGLHRPLATWVVHVGAYFAVGLTTAAWTALLDVVFNPYLVDASGPFGSRWANEFSSTLLSSLVLYAAILAIDSAMEAGERLTQEQTETARLNEALSNAQLSVLRGQIEPHFLFNSLNAIAGLVREGRSDSAVRMIAGLSEFLRRILEDVARQQVPLRDEMAFAQTYVDIQKLRFADRLRLSVEVPSDLQPAQVPSLILQPLVENAVKHGIAKRVQGGAIAISASRSADKLNLRICNDGPALLANWETARHGIGLANVRTRLRGLYGDAFELRLHNVPNGVEVLLSFPFVVGPSAQEA
jgi:two-component system LytT family sensor kinase